MAQLIADLASERQDALQDPIAWLDRHGLAMDSEPVQADTEAA